MILLSSKRGEAFSNCADQRDLPGERGFGVNVEGEAAQSYPESVCASQETKSVPDEPGTKQRCVECNVRGFKTAGSQDLGAGKVTTQRISGQHWSRQERVPDNELVKSGSSTESTMNFNQ